MHFPEHSLILRYSALVLELFARECVCLDWMLKLLRITVLVILRIPAYRLGRSGPLKRQLPSRFDGAVIFPGGNFIKISTDYRGIAKRIELFGDRLREVCFQRAQNCQIEVSVPSNIQTVCADATQGELRSINIKIKKCTRRI